MMQPKGKVKIAGIYVVRIIIFMLFFSICSSPFFIVWDYLNSINKNNGDVTITVGLAKGLTVILGSIYMLTGIWCGWKLRTHSIYNDIYEIDDKIGFDEVMACLKRRGKDKGWSDE